MGLPSPIEVLLVVQLAVSIPEPPALSVQFQFTFTSEVYQPLAPALPLPDAGRGGRRDGISHSRGR